MNVSVFGLGYVGCVSAASLARSGHRVIGVDVNPEKVAMIRDGRSPVVEPGMDDLLAAVVADGRLTATTDGSAAVDETDVALICVGTPGLRDGQPDIAAIDAVGREIGRAVARRRGAFTVVLRSTALPGTTEQVLVPALSEHSGPNVHLRVGVNPEFMREGSALEDFNQPPMVLVGSEDAGVTALVRELYADIRAPFVATTPRTAEAVKYASNAFHALKVCFANEIAEVCDSAGADAGEVMRIFAMDRQLNLSGAYLRPGFAFGGSCLPKDVRALEWSATDAGIQTPILSAILPSNRRQIERAVEIIERAGKRRVGVVGLAFKPGTDDLRDSPAVALVEGLVARGYRVRILDHRIDVARLMGANRRHMESTIPDLASLLCTDVDALIAHAEVLIISTLTADAVRARAQAASGCVVIDLTRGATCW